MSSCKRSQVATPAGFPQWSACGAEIVGTFGSRGDLLVEYKGTVAAVSRNEQREVVRLVRWQVRPLPGLPTGYTRDCESSALHAIVGLKESCFEDKFLGYDVKDWTEDRKILLLEVVQEKQWDEREAAAREANAIGDDLLHCRLRSLQDSEKVLWAEANHLGESQESRGARTNDPAFGDQWGLQAIQAPQAWASFNGSDLRRTVVAIVDSGIDVSHADLKANIRPPGDDQVRFSCFDTSTGGQPEDFEDPDDALPFDSKHPKAKLLQDEDHSHGTFCAGVVGAVANNAKGIAGVHHKPALMPLKFIGPHKTGTVWDASKAIRAAVVGKADVILAAWGLNAFSHCLYHACKLAEEKGILLVTAAGNLNQNIDRERLYPACFKLENGPFPRKDHAYPCPCKKHRPHPKIDPEDVLFYRGLNNIVVVGATVGYGFDGSDSCEPREEKTQTSSWGRQVVDLGAPGYFIRTTRRNHNVKLGGSRLGWASGTSMAAAFVAGALALVKTKFYEKADYQWLKDQLLCTADPVSSLRSYWPEGRRLNLYRAVTEDHDFYQQPTGQQPGTASEEEQADFDVQLRVRATNGNGNGHGTKKAESPPPPGVTHGGNGRPGHAGGGHAH